MVQSCLAEGLREAMGLSSKPLGRHGNCFFPPCASPQGSNQCMHTGLKSQIKSQAAACCREPTCHPSSPIVNTGWHCSRSSHTSLQMQVPDRVCCHQRAPPAPSACARATMPCALRCRALLRESSARKGEPKGLQIPVLQHRHGGTFGLEGPGKPCQVPPARSRVPAPPAALVGQQRGCLCSAVSKKAPSPHFWLSIGLGSLDLPAFWVLLPPTTGCCKTSQGASV